MPRIPLHRLNSDSAVGSAIASTTPGATPSATASPFVAIPGNDELGIIVGYLPQDDQLMMRDIDASVRAVVDPAIHTLKLSAHDARALLLEPNALSNLRCLHLTHCKDADLIDLAATLGKMPKTNFELILQSDLFGRDWVTADSIGPLATVRLAGLTLKDIPVPADMSRALALSISPLSISIPHICSNSSVYEISQIPMLRSLQVGRQEVTLQTIEALRTHAQLETLHINTLSGNAVINLATSQRIRSLTVANMTGGEVGALNALADNHVLTALTLGVDQASGLAALSRNVTLQALSISVSAMPPSLLSSLAGMPALEDFHLSKRGRGVLSISQDDILSLCEKPLKSLSLYEVQMDGAARSRLAAARTASLRLQFCTPFAGEDFAALSHNQSIVSLFMMSALRNKNDDDILSLVTNGLRLLESLDIGVGSEAPEIARASIQAAWTASGRQLANLNLDVRYVSPSPNNGYDSDEGW